MSAPTATTREHGSLPDRLRHVLPRGTPLEEAEWRRRHHLLLWVLGLHVPALTVFGLLMGWGPVAVGIPVAVVAALTLGASLQPRRRPASVLVGAGLAACSMALVIFSNGAIEAYVHVVVVVGLVALYQDWIPFLANLAVTAIGHTLGAAFVPTLIFSHLAGQERPWLWSAVHGACLLAACVGVLLWWRFGEDVQDQRADLVRRLAHAESEKKEVASDLLLTLARRNQTMVQRQLDILGDLEGRERDAVALAGLSRLDHLATRMRRHAESLLVLSGEHPGRVRSTPVPLRDVVRAAVAETEDRERVVVTVDEGLSLVGGAVADLTHLLAELAENAVRHSPPTGPVSIASRPYHPTPGAHLIVVEDTGVGMRPDGIAMANGVLASPGEVDVSASRRLGFHVVARLAARHRIAVSLTPTPGCGLTAVVILPAALFVEARASAPVSQAPSPGPRREAPLSAANGRHSWLGHGPQEPAQVLEAAPTVDAPPAVDEPAADTPQEEEPRRGALIHPLVVPPPRELGDVEPGPATAAAPAPFVEAPAPRTSEEGHGGDGPTLTRRVPQTHLAPGLSRTTQAPAPEPSRSPVVSVGGPSEALSRYQASRRAAHTEIDESTSGTGDQP